MGRSTQLNGCSADSIWIAISTIVGHDSRLCYLLQFLPRIIHERFCCNRRSTATTSLRPAGSPFEPSPYGWGLAPFFLALSPSDEQRDRHRRRQRSQSPGLRAPVSRRGSAISPRTVMNMRGNIQITVSHRGLIVSTRLPVAGRGHRKTMGLRATETQSATLTAGKGVPMIHE